VHEKIAELGSAVFAVIHQVTAAYRFAVGLLELVSEVMDLLRDPGREAGDIGDRSAIPMALPFAEVACEREIFVLILVVIELFVLLGQLELKHAGQIRTAPAVGH
jgi:hypothetical protein